jgi:hypothetical protein
MVWFNPNGSVQNETNEKTHLGKLSNNCSAVVVHRPAAIVSAKPVGGDTWE